MTTKVTKWLNGILSFLIGLLGFSCTLHALEYGVPSADFTLDGEVCNEDKEPLENIQIVWKKGSKDGEGTMHWKNWHDTLYTNVDGKYYLNIPGDFPFEFHQVIASDTSGVYASDTINTSVAYSGGDGHWYYGEGHLRADFVLKPQSK